MDKKERYTYREVRDVIGYGPETFAITDTSVPGIFGYGVDLGECYLEEDAKLICKALNAYKP